MCKALAAPNPLLLHLFPNGCPWVSTLFLCIIRFLQKKCISHIKSWIGMIYVVAVHSCIQWTQWWSVMWFELHLCTEERENDDHSDCTIQGLVHVAHGNASSAAQDLTHEQDPQTSTHAPLLISTIRHVAPCALKKKVEVWNCMQTELQSCRFWWNQASNTLSCSAKLVIWYCWIDAFQTESNIVFVLFPHPGNIISKSHSMLSKISPPHLFSTPAEQQVHINVMQCISFCG